MKILTSKKQDEIAIKLTAIGIMALSGNMEEIETGTKFIEVLADLCVDLCGIESAIKIRNTIFERENKKLERLENEVKENDRKTV